MYIPALAFLTSFFWQSFIARQLIYFLGPVFHHRFSWRFYQEVTLLKTRPSMFDFFIEILWLSWAISNEIYCSYSHWHWTLGPLSSIYLGVGADPELFSEESLGPAQGTYSAHLKLRPRLGSLIYKQGCQTWCLRCWLLEHKDQPLISSGEGLPSRSWWGSKALHSVPPNA